MTAAQRKARLEATLSTADPTYTCSIAERSNRIAAHPCSSPSPDGAADRTFAAIAKFNGRRIHTMRDLVTARREASLLWRFQEVMATQTPFKRCIKRDQHDGHAQVKLIGYNQRRYRLSFEQVHINPTAITHQLRNIAYPFRRALIALFPRLNHW